MFAMKVITTVLSTVVGIVFAYVMFTVQYQPEAEEDEQLETRTIDTIKFLAFLGVLTQILAIYLIWR